MYRLGFLPTLYGIAHMQMMFWAQKKHIIGAHYFNYVFSGGLFSFQKAIFWKSQMCLETQKMKIFHYWPYQGWKRKQFTLLEGWTLFFFYLVSSFSLSFIFPSYALHFYVIACYQLWIMISIEIWSK